MGEYAEDDLLAAEDEFCTSCQSDQCDCSEIKDEEKVTATWTIELNCHCPRCKEYVDLTDHLDFWECHRGMDAGESGTLLSTDAEVVCPECGHEFQADFEY